MFKLFHPSIKELPNSFDFCTKRFPLQIDIPYEVKHVQTCMFIKTNFTTPVQIIKVGIQLNKVTLNDYTSLLQHATIYHPDYSDFNLHSGMINCPRKIFNYLAKYEGKPFNCGDNSTTEFELAKRCYGTLFNFAWETNEPFVLPDDIGLTLFPEQMKFCCGLTFRFG